jgi:hypothetical protein
VYPGRDFLNFVITYSLQQLDNSYRTAISHYTRDRHQYPAARRYMHTSSVLLHILTSIDMQRGDSTAAVYTLSSITPSRATPQPPSSQLLPTLHNFNVHTMLRHVLNTQRIAARRVRPSATTVKTLANSHTRAGEYSRYTYLSPTLELPLKQTQSEMYIMQY